MPRLSAELVAAMNRQGRLAEQGGTRIVARSESPAGSETFRSGWSRSPQLIAPSVTSPASSDTSTRSNRSAPSCFGVPFASAPSDTSTRSNRSTPSCFGVPVASAPVASAMTRSGSAPCGRRNISCDKVAQWDLSDSRTSRTRHRSRATLATQPVNHDVDSVRPRAQSVASERSDSSKLHDDSVRSSQTEPSFMVPPVYSGSSAPDVQGPRHEGWLSKRTSHKMAARWQCRYWTLEASTLRYHKQPGGPCLRSFDIRRAQRIEKVPGAAREIDLDFGFRVWRLRAEDSQSARRWLLLLEAARLVAGEPCGGDGEEAGNWSDDDTASSCSTADTITSDAKADQDVQRRDRTLTTRANSILPSTMQSFFSKAVDLPPPKVELLSAAAIADRLEVDPDALDRCFDSWLKSETADDGTPHFGSPKPPGLRNGLSDALIALWAAFGGKDPESAVLSWN